MPFMTIVVCSLICKQTLVAYIANNMNPDQTAPVWSLVFKTNYRLMQVKSIAECSPWSILQYFRPSLSYSLSLKTFVFSIFEWSFYTGYTVLLFYCLLTFVKNYLFQKKCSGLNGLDQDQDGLSGSKLFAKVIHRGQKLPLLEGKS